MTLHKSYIRILFLTIISFFFHLSGYAIKNWSFEEIISLKLPILVLNTIDSEEPTCDYVGSPPGSMGGSITNETKVPGSIKLYSSDGNLEFDSGDYIKGESGMTIKIRGNTSAFGEKNLFKINFPLKFYQMGLFPTSQDYRFTYII